VLACGASSAHAWADEESTTVAPTIGKSDDVSALVGKTVSAVDVEVGASTWPETKVPELHALRPGDLFSLDKLRAVMDELTAGGQFAAARAQVEKDGHAARVTIHVTPRRMIESLRVDVHGARFERDDILRAADLQDGGEIIASNVPAHLRGVEDFVKKRGYPAPKVTLAARATDDPSRMTVILDIVPGVPQIIARRVFYIVGERPPFVDAVTSKYSVSAGDTADETALATADTELATLFAARGYWSAQVSHDVVPWTGGLVARIRVALGPRTVITYEGNQHYDASALDSALALDDEPDKSPLRLTQKLQDFYVKRGYLDVEVNASMRPGPTGDLNVLAFKILEHPRVQVTARTYPCLREAETKKLTGGGPRNPKEIGEQIDSYLEEELPGADAFVDPRPSGIDAVLGGDRAPLPQSTKATPSDLDPDAVYAPDTYENAVSHVQELYRSEGFLSALVGPVLVVRKRCAPKSPPGMCEPLPLPDEKADVCPYDASSLPLPSPPLDPADTCTPDAAKGIECDPHVSLKIPVKLGPRTTLYDLAFRGVRSIPTQTLASGTGLSLGDPVNTVKLDEARRNVLDLYKEEGFAFADVRYTLETSPDHTRARAHFDIAEGEKVIVKNIVVRGNTRTDLDVIMKRVALKVGQPYRASNVRKTQERIATLNVFSSITVGLEDPYVPDRNKVVVVTVAENLPQYVNPSGGFSTGEGFRIGFEYGHNNLGGRAISFNVRLSVSYLPTALILDPVAAANYDPLPLSARLGTRLTATVGFPEIGLGPLVRGQIDGLGVHDLQRDFYITKIAVIPNAVYRPARGIQIALYQTAELNDVSIFQGQNIQKYLSGLAAAGTPPSADLQRLLTVPDGQSIAFAERLVFTWDRRDNAFNATKGTYSVSGIEHVDAFPQSWTTPEKPPESHFLRLSETLGGYVPLPRGMRIAALLRLGYNYQLTSQSVTYPDRYFFLGGVDSMRGWQQNSFLPQDNVDQVTKDKAKPDQVGGAPGVTSTGPCLPPAPCQPNPLKFIPSTRPIHGGDLMFNPKLELRIPIRDPIETALFTDVGNLWVDPTYPFKTGRFPMRASVGTGLRVQTPVGPLAFDYGVNVLRVLEPSQWAWEDPWAINFAIGLF
jgi:outer membrane protein assembly factor BamA